jgi:polysaccharide export outer membrane protein
MNRLLIWGLLLILGSSGCVNVPVKEGVYGKDGKKPWFSSQPSEKFVRISSELDPETPEQEPPFGVPTSATAQAFATPSEIRSFSDAVESRYQIGPGDRFAFRVRGREDVSREEVVVAPDGLVSLPRVGIFKIEDMTLIEATEYTESKLKAYYEDPEVTIELSTINNNQVYVLGRVANPGAVHFSGQGTLLEALSLAGGLPADTRLSFLSRCMIVRGNEMLIWVDLRELLEKGNLALNTRLQNGDFIFIPQSEDQIAYVLGEVPRPGVMVLRSEMTVLDAVMYAGGPTLNADDQKIFLVRTLEGKGYVTQVDMENMIKTGDMRMNYKLRDGDIVYVSQSGVGKINTFLTQLLPGMRAVDFTISTGESFGAMAELRNRIWGQEGFINPAANQ